MGNYSKDQVNGLTFPALEVGRGWAPPASRRRTTRPTKAWTENENSAFYHDPPSRRPRVNACRPISARPILGQATEFSGRISIDPLSMEIELSEFSCDSSAQYERVSDGSLLSGEI